MSSCCYCEVENIPMHLLMQKCGGGYICINCIDEDVDCFQCMECRLTHLTKEEIHREGQKFLCNTCVDKDIIISSDLDDTETQCFQFKESGWVSVNDRKYLTDEQIKQIENHIDFEGWEDLEDEEDQ